MTFSTHELTQYALLSSLFNKNGNHKLNTSVTYISHELIQYAFANHTFENKK